VHGFDHDPYGSPTYSFDRATAAAQSTLQVLGGVAKESTGCVGHEHEARRARCHRSRQQLGYDPTPALLSPCSLKQQEQEKTGNKIRSEGKEREEGKARLPERNRRLEGMDAGRGSDALP
jgi:hypothetical protein